ncbi:hypothetical protein DFH07DRAFT_500196 [Mycena maculata]|uniref:Uncharacterized protein n=1 Tax=Mycena maculata TaxID=230809 RepID=A0AAD7NCY5_9AGAR|nr:hypothetical protein DFH07DRAFT_500196 [Mycena maculata]
MLEDSPKAPEAPGRGFPLALRNRIQGEQSKICNFILLLSSLLLQVGLPLIVSSNCLGFLVSSDKETRRGLILLRETHWANKSVRIFCVPAPLLILDGSSALFLACRIFLQFTLASSK